MYFQYKSTQVVNWDSNEKKIVEISTGAFCAFLGVGESRSRSKNGMNSKGELSLLKFMPLACS